MTHRQFVAWQAWEQGEWNRPDRHDYYVMQTAAEVRRGNSKNPRSVQTDHMRIPFRFEELKSPNLAAATDPEISPEIDLNTPEGKEWLERQKATAKAKAAHVAAAGGKVRVIKKPASERPGI